MLGSSRKVELKHLQALDPKSILINIVSTSGFREVWKTYPRHQTKGMIQYARAIAYEPKFSFRSPYLLTLMFFDRNYLGHCGLQYSHVSKYPSK